MAIHNSMRLRLWRCRSIASACEVESSLFRAWWPVEPATRAVRSAPPPRSPRSRDMSSGSGRTMPTGTSRRALARRSTPARTGTQITHSPAHSPRRATVNHHRRGATNLKNLTQQTAPRKRTSPHPPAHSSRPGGSADGSGEEGPANESRTCIDRPERGGRRTPPTCLKEWGPPLPAYAPASAAQPSASRSEHRHADHTSPQITRRPSTTSRARDHTRHSPRRQPHSQPYS